MPVLPTPTSHHLCLELRLFSKAAAKVNNVFKQTNLNRKITRKQQSQQLFDQDFLSFAPFVIMDWKGLNDNTYEKIVIDSNDWSIEEISVITHLKDLFIETVNPVIRYTDQGGAEQTAPLNFLGGIKSIFLISDPFGQLV